MMLKIMDSLKDMAEVVNKFITKNADNYFFWIIVFLILVVIGLIAISKFADK